MKQLKNYQYEKVEHLLVLSKMFFSSNDTDTIIFQSPTGSGKTFMITNYISEIIDQTDLDLCFIWVSIGDGGLVKQSKKSVERDIDPRIKCSLIEQEFFGSRNKINRNEIVFLNWEKIRNKNRDTNQYTNVLMKDKDSINFIEVLENTRNIDRNIILIIDESHAGATTERAMELRDDIIKPFFTIEMSATPVLTSDIKVTVDPNRVVEEQMIKKEVIINDSIKEIVDDEITSEELILKAAIKKRERLSELYRAENSTINPLVLIQLPNSTAGEAKKEYILELFKSLNIKEENIAIWLNDEKINNDYETLNKNDSKIEYLIFKQAIDTGWDCPRAHILVKLRESNSIIFEIQTVGRILRMPEAKHYNTEELNKAYVYTNIKSIQIKKELYNPNIIKNLCVDRKSIYENIKLKSYYRNRVDYGDITSSFKIFFEKAMCNYFNIPNANDEITNPHDNLKKLKEKDIMLEYSKLDSIISDLEINSINIDKNIFIKDEEILNVTMSERDLEIEFNNLLFRNLGGFAPKRSLPSVKSSVIFFFKKYLGITPNNGGITLVQNIIVNNQERFSEVLQNAVADYKIFHKEELDKKTPGRINNDWEIPLTINYNPDLNMEIPSNLSIMEKLFLPVGKNGKVDSLEEEFIKYLEKHSEFIKWFWKNGDEHMESNFGIKKFDGYTFQPDFIISFKDGRIGIFDTKAWGFNENDNVDKSNSLYNYISAERYNGKNLIGGLVIFDDQKFKYFAQPIYKTYSDSPEDWYNFDDLF